MDTRLPIDARASVIVLAAQLEALESVIRARRRLSSTKLP